MARGWSSDHVPAAALIGRQCSNCGLVGGTVPATWAWHAYAPTITWPLCDDCKANHERLDAVQGDRHQHYEPIPAQAAQEG